MTSRLENRRKTLVINKPMQRRLILTMSLFPAIGLSATMILVAIFCHRLHGEAVAAEVELKSLVPMFLSMAAFIFISGIFLLVNALKVSHRVAGPAYRICESIRRIREGDLAFTVNLRKGDHLHNVREELNLLLDHLNENPPPGSHTREMAEAAAEAGEPVGAD